MEMQSPYLTSLRIKEKPYNLLGLIALLFFIVSIFVKGGAIDINTYDTYYVIANVSLYRVFAGVLLFSWSLYLIFGRFVWSKRLTWLHVVFTILSLTFFATGLWRVFTLAGSLDGIPRGYYAFTDFPQKSHYLSVGTICITVLAVWVLGQLLFLVNIIGGAITRLRKL